MTHLRNLLTAGRWWSLEPDAGHTLLTDGLGAEDERAAAARTFDGSFALIYLPSARDITLSHNGTTPLSAGADPQRGRV
jgi:hypothetical protein